MPACEGLCEVSKRNGAAGGALPPLARSAAKRLPHSSLHPSTRHRLQVGMVFFFERLNPAGRLERASLPLRARPRAGPTVRAANRIFVMAELGLVRKRPGDRARAGQGAGAKGKRGAPVGPQSAQDQSFGLAPRRRLPPLSGKSRFASHLTPCPPFGLASSGSSTLSTTAASRQVVREQRKLSSWSLTVGPRS